MVRAVVHDHMDLFVSRDHVIDDVQEFPGMLDLLKRPEVINGQIR